MALDLSSITGFKDQEKLPLITKMHYGFRTASILKSKQVGIKGTQSLNTLDISATFQDGSACGWNAGGATTLSQRDITVGAITLQESLCVRNLKKTWISKEMEAGSKGNEVLPFATDYSQEKIKLVQDLLEKAVWQGSTSLTDPNLNKFNGFLYHISGSTGVTVSTSVTANTVTNSNAFSIVAGIIGDIPESIAYAPDLVLFLSTDFYAKYIANLATMNLFNQSPIEQADKSIYHLGTNVKVTAVPGLPVGRGVLSYNENFVLGFDALSDETGINIWYSQDNNEVRSQIDLAYGTQIAFPSQVVYWKTN